MTLLNNTILFSCKKDTVKVYLLSGKMPKVSRIFLIKLCITQYLQHNTTFAIYTHILGPSPNGISAI